MENLFLAIIDNNLLMIEHLINSKINGKKLIDMKLNGISPFEYTCSVGSEEAVKLFLDSHIDIDTSNAYSYALLNNNSDKIIRTLLYYRISPDDILESKDIRSIHKILVNMLTLENDTCSICLEIDKNPMILTKCGHKFHIICIEEWLLKNKKNSCPNCRNKLAFGKSSIKKHFIVQ